MVIPKDSQMAEKSVGAEAGWSSGPKWKEKGSGLYMEKLWQGV